MTTNGYYAYTLANKGIVDPICADLVLKAISS
jgi:hypothetical protein